MTVKELIRNLRNMDETLPVYVQVDGDVAPLTDGNYAIDVSRGDDLVAARALILKGSN